jgi:Ser-tRNA(Ala) deacylase AlaX
VTQLLWLEEPGRKTCLATVTGTRGPAFLLDRSIYCPASHAYRHPQPADRGEVWLGGDKRLLTRVFWDRGELRHVVRGAVPARGAKANCHLDVERRLDAAAAHTALHLLLSAFARGRLGLLTEEPRVQGGRQFTVTARWARWSPEALKALLDEANAAAARKLEVGSTYATRDALHDVDAQPFADGVLHPGPEATLRVVRIGDASALPCDGTLLDSTARLGRITARSVGHLEAGTRIQFCVG